MLIFDIETNNKLYSRVSELWCVCAIDTDIQQEYRCAGEDAYNFPTAIIQPYLDKGGIIAGHNVILYDIPVLEKLSNWRFPEEKRAQVLDTLTLSHLIYNGRIDSHSLKAWGERIGVEKGTYCEENAAFNDYTADMLNYCMQDVRVTQSLVGILSKADRPTPLSMQIEYKTYWLCHDILVNGFGFDKDKAVLLKQKLEQDYNAVLAEIKSLNLMINDKPYNPASPAQTAWLILNYYHYPASDARLWKDSVNKKTREPKHTLSTDKKAIALMLADKSISSEMRRFLELHSGASQIKRILTMLTRPISVGPDVPGTGWLEYIADDARIHGNIAPGQAVTARATHNSPNIAQVPSEKLDSDSEFKSEKYGRACRGLFYPGREGWLEVGIDVKSLEARTLGHYLYPYDNGTFARAALQGDIHERNQKLAGLETRAQAKTLLYAYMFGIGDSTLGQSLGGDVETGHKMKEKFAAVIPALPQLVSALKKSLTEYDAKNKTWNWKRQWLKMPDGRHIFIDNTRICLSRLIQSAGAVICKTWITRTDERLKQRGLISGTDYIVMAWIHDELQIAAKNKITADIIAAEAQAAIREAQQMLQLRCQLDVDAVIGKNWGECH